MPIKPAIDLGPKVKIRSKEDLQEAMIVLRSVVSQSGQLKARYNAKVAELDADLAERDCVSVGESSLPCDVYADTLREAIEGYLRSEPADLEGQRTLEFPAGMIEIRKNPDKIEAVEGQTILALTKRAVERINKDEAATAFLEQFGLADFFRVELKADLSGMKTLLDKKKLTKTELRKAGFVTLAGEDRIDIKVGTKSGD